MLYGFLDHRFLARLEADGPQAENPRIERVLAYSRLFLAATAIFAIRLQPDVPAPYYWVEQVMLVAYGIHCLLQLLWLHHSEPGNSFVIYAQIGDIVWPILLSFVSDAPNAVFAVFFGFALMAAAFRWGFPETMLTAFISVALLIAQNIILLHSPQAIRGLASGRVEWHRVVLRCGSLLLTGFLLGYLSEMEKELRAEIAFTNRLLSVTRIGNRFADVVHQVSSEFARVFGTDDIYQVIYQLTTGRLYRWELHEQASSARVREIAPVERTQELMPAYPYAFYMQQGGQRRIVEALDEDGSRLDAAPYEKLPMPLTADSVLAVKLKMGSEWEGRFVLRNPKLGHNRERELRFAFNVLTQIAPALYSMYLFRRLRSRAGAVERARVARELHDTSVQSLIGIEMEVDVLRRSANGNGVVGLELKRVQELLRQEVLNLRELMQSIRAIDVGPYQFLDFAAELVERFRRDTGLEAQFVSEVSQVTLPARVCRELSRVVQEGLVNVRKHSGAHSVCVRFAAANGSWKLIIADDGKGFLFTGRQTLSELEALRRGPRVIKERVRAMGGDLILESSPGHGCKLEITVPQKGVLPYD
jgi:signal transduction histidine kinase